MLWQDDNFDDPESLEADPLADPDLDQRSNVFEYLVSTDALDAGTAWQIDSEVHGGQVTLTIPVTQNRFYKIQVSNDLENWMVWSTSGNPFQVGEEQVGSVPVTGPHSGGQFFRIRIDETKLASGNRRLLLRARANKLIASSSLR